MLNKYKEYVLSELIFNPDTRSNDKLLIRNVIQKKYGTTDINQLLDVSGNMFEAIRRCRQQIQRTNPNLRPVDKVADMRAVLEQEVREEVLNGLNN